MNWSELSMSERSELMKLYLKNGITSLSAMKEHYNSFQAGGSIEDKKDNPPVDAISGAARQAINTRKVIDDVNMFYTLDVVPRLVREHKGLSTIPNINFPKVERENIVEDVTPNREYDGYVNLLGSDIHINPIQYYKNEQRFGELLTHENAHVWQHKFPHLDSEYKNSKKEFLKKAYGNWNNKLRKSFSPLTPVGQNYRFNTELEADNRAVRYRIWDDLKNTIGRVPTLEELDNYINTIDDAVLYKKYIKPSGYLDIYSISKDGDYFKENMQRVRQALIHVAQNNVQENTSHYAANGGSLGHITNLGQWKYPGEVTTIPSNNITMKGVDYPVLGISNTGDAKLMQPNEDYKFNGSYVTEYPVHKFQRGGQHIPYEAKAKLSEDIMTQIWMPGYKRKYRDDVLLQAGPMQASFLLNGSDKDRYMLKHGYIKGQEGDYGLVRKAVGNKNYPIYQTTEDDESRDNLVPIGNIMASDSHNWWGQETAKLRHAGSYPTTLYIDGRNPEKFYQKAWDLNDYGSTRGTKSKMNLTGTLKANILDLIGNPAVQTSGYSRIDIDNLTSHHKPSTKQRVLQKHFEDYLKGKNITREVLEDGTVLYAHPEVTVVGYKD